MARLRIVLFGSSSNFTAGVLQELAAVHEIAGVVRPGPTSGLRSALGALRAFARARPIEVSARRLGIPIVNVSAAFDEPIRERLRQMRPDLICVALFPRRIPAEVCAIAPLGAINAHPSLLPRHRGPLPLFWTYHADDRRTGVTVHHVTERFDAGDIVLQEAFELSRGHAVAALDHATAQGAARLLREAADAIAGGVAPRVRQDESAATYAPLVRRGVPMIPFDEWPVERVWHFLAGLCPNYREPLCDAAGRRVAYRCVRGFRAGSTGTPVGAVTRSEGLLLLACRGGVVELA